MSHVFVLQVAFKVYDIDGDEYISNGELFQVLKMMVGNNLTEDQLQQIVDKTILEGDEDKDGKISYAEFKKVRKITGNDQVPGWHPQITFSAFFTMTTWMLQ